MSIFNVTCDPFAELRRACTTAGKYLCQLRSTATTLEQEMKALRDIRRDVESSVKSEMSRQHGSLRCKDEVTGWMKMVDDLSLEEQKYQEDLSNRGTNTCFRRCNCWSNFKLTKSANELRRRVEWLKDQREKFEETLVISEPNVQSTARTLEQEMQTLKNIRRDVEGEVQNQMSRQAEVSRTQHGSLKCKEEVTGWMERVDKLSSDEQRYQEDLSNRGTNTCGSNFNLIKSANELLEQVRLLKAQKDDFGETLVIELPRGPVELVPAESPESLVGLEERLSLIRAKLEDPNAGIIGVWGMGGVGKTTLLKRINNELEERNNSGFEIVIWVTVSQDYSVEKIQKDIAKRLRLDLQGEEEEDATTLFNALSGKKYCLLMDDVWERQDWTKIGVPEADGENKCKIIFTTRSQHVCLRSEATEVEIPLLSDSESWNLFRKKLCNEVVLKNPKIEKLARETAKRCDRLPLVLVTVARAMATATTTGQWRAANEDLKRLEGMDDVLARLNFSFDKLKNDTLRSCLLYYVLYPEDDEISKEEIIKLWMGEGFLDEEEGAADSGNSSSCFDKGMEVIDSLVAACMLQSCEEEDYVQMHDSIRAMALWLTNGVNDESNKFMSYAGKHLNLVPRIKDEDWKQSKRISLSFNRIRELPETVPTCPTLSTLLLSWNMEINKIPITFFNSFPALTVLDLRRTCIDIIPVEVGSLRELRYLNLYRTRIRSLPEALGNLTKLRFLNLGYTPLEEIPLAAIRTLENLQALNMCFSLYEWLGDQSGHDIVKDGAGRQLSVMDLERLPRLDELGMSCRSLHPLERVHFSHLLAKSVQYLHLGRISGLTIDGVVDCLRHMKNIKELCLSCCDELEGTLKIDGNCFPQNLRELFLEDLPSLSGIHVVNPEHMSISVLEIKFCDNLIKLVGLEQIYTLKTIALWNCSRIEELISDAAEVASIGDQGFPCLRELTLFDLPALRCISSEHPLHFPSLRRLSVHACPHLDTTGYERHLEEINVIMLQKL